MEYFPFLFPVEKLHGFVKNMNQPGNNLILDVGEMFGPGFCGEGCKVGEDVVDVNRGIGSGAAAQAVVKGFQLGLSFEEDSVGGRRPDPGVDFLRWKTLQDQAGITI